MPSSPISTDISESLDILLNKLSCLVVNGHCGQLTRQSRDGFRLEGTDPSCIVDRVLGHNPRALHRP